VRGDREASELAEIPQLKPFWYLVERTRLGRGGFIGELGLQEAAVVCAAGAGARRK
jgi:hypothetical protein